MHGAGMLRILILVEYFIAFHFLKHWSIKARDRLQLYGSYTDWPPLL